MVRLNLGIRQKPDTSTLRRPAWYKASESQISSYKADLLNRLEVIPVPVSLEVDGCEDTTHSVERDTFVLEMLSSVIEASHTNIPMVGGRKEAVRPDCSSMPGW